MYTFIKFTQTVFSRLILSRRSHGHKTSTVGRTPGRLKSVGATDFQNAHHPAMHSDSEETSRRQESKTLLRSSIP
jgi:hypothetical protein